MLTKSHLIRTLSKGKRRSTKPTETPTSSAQPSYPVVLSPIEQSTPPLPKPLAAAPPRAPPSAFPSTLPSRTQSASTGKAKKVMDWFRKKSLVHEIENENPMGTMAPQVVVTDPTSTTRVAAPGGGSAPPSAWSGQRVASTTAITQNGHGLLQLPAGRPTRSASTREGSEAHTPTSTSSGPPAGAMRVHEGAVDPGAVTSGAPPDQVYARVLDVLRGMGVEISTETLYKAQCVRPKQRKDGARQSGLAAFNITGLGGSNGVSRVDECARRLVFNRVFTSRRIVAVSHCPLTIQLPVSRATCSAGALHRPTCRLLVRRPPPGHKVKKQTISRLSRRRRQIPLSLFIIRLILSRRLLHLSLPNQFTANAAKTRGERFYSLLSLHE